MRQQNYPLKAFLEHPLSVGVAVSKAEDELRVQYVISGDVSDLQWPAKKAVPQRRDGLWQATCLEFFLASAKHGPYIELNFCPSGDWAAYLFTDYRQGRSDPAVCAPCIHIDTKSDAKTETKIDTSLVMDVLLPWSPLCDLLQNTDELLFAVTACLQCGDTQSFWSHAHAADKPDFHNKRLYKQTI